MNRTILLLTLALAACSQAQALTPPAYTPYPTYTPPPTAALAPTYTPYPTYTSIPTANTQPAPSHETDPLTAPHGPGYYLVGIDIAPGLWRSKLEPQSDRCAWRRRDRLGELLDIYVGFSGVTVYIEPADFAVELGPHCGEWTYLGPP